MPIADLLRRKQTEGQPDLKLRCNVFLARSRGKQTRSLEIREECVSKHLWELESRRVMATLAQAGGSSQCQGRCTTLYGYSCDMPCKFKCLHEGPCVCRMHDVRAGACAYQAEALRKGIDPYVNSSLLTLLSNLKSLATNPVSVFFHNCGGKVARGFECPGRLQGVPYKEVCHLYAHAHFCQEAELLLMQL